MKDSTSHSSDPQSPAGQRAPLGWHPYPAGWSPAASKGFLSVLKHTYTVEELHPHNVSHLNKYEVIF